MVKNGVFVVSSDRWRTLKRQMAGGLIWATQTRFCASATTTFLSTSGVACIGDVGKTLDYIKMYNKLIKELQAEKDAIWFNRFDMSQKPSTKAFVGGNDAIRVR